MDGRLASNAAGFREWMAEFLECSGVTTPPTGLPPIAIAILWTGYTTCGAIERLAMRLEDPGEDWRGGDDDDGPG